jgi:hypothetical protein
MAAITARFMIKSSAFEQTLNVKTQQHFKTAADDWWFRDVQEANASNKTNERKLFNWIKEAFIDTFYGSYSGSHSFYPQCGRPYISPHLVNTRIMNGREATASSWPWTVSIGLEGPREYVPHACGGTLINKRYLITAAHCVLK